MNTFVSLLSVLRGVWFRLDRPRVRQLPLSIGSFPGWVMVLGTLLSSPVLWAFPPALHHTFYGIVRDEYGRPLDVKGAEIILETSAGSRLKTRIITNLEPGVNYRLNVPMDAGLTDDSYKPTALKPAAPFRIQVKIGSTVFLPIEMKGDLNRIGQPGKSTRLNLTLGEDSDGDGLPDAWERAIIALTGSKKTIAEIKGGGDEDRDGLTNLQEYIAGTYAFDPKDGFALKIVGSHGSSAVLQFTAIKGRTYRVLSSSDLTQWMPVAFRIRVPSGTTAEVSSYSATDITPLEVEVASESTSSPLVVFKLLVE